jgi:hypothetical protein
MIVKETTACCKPNAAASPFQCACHEKMGNDFWFLPTGSCLEKPALKEEATNG